MKKDIQLRVVNSKVILLSILVMPILLLIIYFMAGKISHYTTNQTYFIIMSLSVIACINFSIIKKSSKLVNFSFSDSLLHISSDMISTEIHYSNINNYNIYYLIIKKMGYMIRIKESKNYFFWITFKNFDKKEKTDDEDYKIICEFFNRADLQKKTIDLDRNILFLALLPLILSIIGLLGFVGVCYYIFFII